ncbi:hypothetical protein [Caulobacter mirabilis]|uniref:Uncharacterized protein n=1 Tax=Caulobacter mirabilis TaxID=69666 RepID=A0A2D2B449_9CAUL|nr:hypothetical protein [Caulobacter mirabilis]ATQ45015.1 hypothetical protein CSW64_13930 [Caulobacter mirabilis]
MRTTPIILLSLALGACATTSPPPSGRIQTTDEVNRSGVVGAASAPMRDLNLLRTKIPTVLLDALDDPYARPQPATCRELIALLEPLNEALGADIDEPPSPDGRDLIDKGRDVASDTAFGMMAGAAQDLIPLRGWVRKLTGAEQHDRLVRAAITAGGIRRGYLKGLGESRGCNPPATPSHILTEMPKPDRRTGPKYPVK